MNQVIDKPVAESTAKRIQSSKNDVIISNARIVLANEVVYGSLVVKDGIITDISTTMSSVASAVDAENDYIIPGLVELHTDNLEKHLYKMLKTNLVRKFINFLSNSYHLQT